MIDVCDGSVSGTVLRACVNRTPRDASAVDGRHQPAPEPIGAQRIDRDQENVRGEEEAPMGGSAARCFQRDRQQDRRREARLTSD